MKPSKHCDGDSAPSTTDRNGYMHGPEFCRADGDEGAVRLGGLRRHVLATFACRFGERVNGAGCRPFKRCLLK